MQQNNFFKKVGSNPWTVTLVGTMVGAFLGIFLSNYVTNQKEINRKNDAFEVVLTELQENHQSLIQWDSISKSKFEPFKTLMNHFDFEEEEIIMTSEEMAHLKTINNEIFVLLDSTKVNDTQYYYSLELTLNFESSLILLEHGEIAWSAFKNSPYLHYLKFECIRNIDFYYKSYAKTNALRGDWFNSLLEGGFQTETELSQIIQNWNLEIQLTSSLIDTFEHLELENCG